MTDPAREVQIDPAVLIEVLQTRATDQYRADQYEIAKLTAYAAMLEKRVAELEQSATPERNHP